ncbi:MAG: hypothetical protein KC609_03660 [Myxococcales bacterium]|nr:hypothetical protein [Myxococcales bacterium]
MKRRTALILAGAGAASLIAAILLIMLSEKGPEPYQNDSFSYSAVGFRAFRLTTNAWGYHTFSSRRGILRSWEQSSWLAVFAEPYIDKKLGFAALSRWLARVTEKGGRALVVLPKWIVTRHPKHEGWATGLKPVPVSETVAALNAAIFARPGIDVKPNNERDCRVRRPKDAGTMTWAAGDGHPLTLPVPQLIDSACAELTPLVSSAKGMLLAVNSSGTLFVLSDPDLLNNAGLHKNALAVYEMLQRWFPVRSIVFDETVHGYTGSAGFWSELFRFPLVLLLGHLLLVAALAIWAGLRRFGKIVPDPPELSRGKETLIENAARLFEMGRFYGYSLRRYLEIALRDAASLFGVGADGRELAAIAKARGVEEDIVAISREVAALPEKGRDEKRYRRLAQQIQRWRAGILKDFGG